MAYHLIWVRFIFHMRTQNKSIKSHFGPDLNDLPHSVALYVFIYSYAANFNMKQ